MQRYNMQHPPWEGTLISTESLISLLWLTSSSVEPHYLRMAAIVHKRTPPSSTLSRKRDLKTAF